MLPSKHCPYRRSFFLFSLPRRFILDYSIFFPLELLWSWLLSWKMISIKSALPLGGGWEEDKGEERDKRKNIGRCVFFHTKFFLNNSVSWCLFVLRAIKSDRHHRRCNRRTNKVWEERLNTISTGSQQYYFEVNTAPSNSRCLTMKSRLMRCLTVLPEHDLDTYRQRREPFGGLRNSGLWPTGL